ncbi:hypothetical protein AB0H43_06055 [Hamadaea sp. NPDC050747]|uniref:hypothetical protein n=1 Tax=Hamadaea sp. NPDC050747 TaxID=3155789 RepID=UPI0033F40DEF
MHDVLIVLHAAAGVIAFVLGVMALYATPQRSWSFAAYAVSLAAMAIFLLIVVATDWPDLDGSARGVYAGLLVLAAYMLYRCWRAWQRLRRQGSGQRGAYADDIGFTLISLFDGFVIVAAIDLDAPVWLVVVIAIAGVAAGIAAVGQVKRRLSPEW